MRVEELDIYNYFERITHMPRSLNRYQEFSYKDGYLIFYTGQVMSPICSLSIELKSIKSSSIQSMSSTTDRIYICFDDNNELVLYAYKNTKVN